MATSPPNASASSLLENTPPSSIVPKEFASQSHAAPSTTGGGGRLEALQLGGAIASTPEFRSSTTSSPESQREQPMGDLTPISSGRLRRMNSSSSPDDHHGAEMVRAVGTTSGTREELCPPEGGAGASVEQEGKGLSPAGDSIISSRRTTENIMYGPGLTAGIDHWRWGHTHRTPSAHPEPVFLSKEKHFQTTKSPEIPGSRFPLK